MCASITEKRTKIHFYGAKQKYLNCVTTTAKIIQIFLENQQVTYFSVKHGFATYVQIFLLSLTSKQINIFIGHNWTRFVWDFFGTYVSLRSFCLCFLIHPQSHLASLLRIFIFFWLSEQKNHVCSSLHIKISVYKFSWKIIHTLSDDRPHVKTCGAAYRTKA